MSIIPFFSEEDRVLIDLCRISTPDYREGVLTHLEFLRECMVDEEEQNRIDRLLRVIGRRL
jgi:hypothetical protein